MVERARDPVAWPAGARRGVDFFGMASFLESVSTAFDGLILAHNKLIDQQELSARSDLDRRIGQDQAGLLWLILNSLWSY